MKVAQIGSQYCGVEAAAQHYFHEAWLYRNQHYLVCEVYLLDNYAYVLHLGHL
ncbi:hypothetical protein FHS56_002251 [Thermonema lapsum]|uniref:Uncharacterized protein n=1 Tax=Thermonema lapsum TaxID=28195 RepID=A0A846MTE4_9BACT|nr:hypothetical protein [Thermonema lapsum]NIK74719.1 hypothetical protein [Thermonema lapsum]